MDELSIIARELRAARERLKLTREQLAEKIAYTAGYIEKIETGKLPATEPYVTAAAKVLAEGVDAVALFGRLREDGRREAVPGWFRPWTEHEREATKIRWYEPLLVPGLLQTEDYARAVLRDEESWPHGWSGKMYSARPRCSSSSRRRCFAGSAAHGRRWPSSSSI